MKTVVHPAVKIQSVSKWLLKDITFSVNEGETFFVIGKSGSGKSVLLKTIMGLIQPDSGTILVDRSQCGMVFQQPALFDSITLKQNIGYGLKQTQLSPQAIDQRIEEVCEWVQINPSLLSLFPENVSFGTQKLISLARTLILKPKILLFDEPTTALDPVATRKINSMIQSVSLRLGATCIVVSHDMTCAVEIAKRILFLDQGKMISILSPADFFESKNTPKNTPKNTMISDFMNEVLT
jgi:phospholipid/cholesterol/gamma-HCH transport system ATP-binding protein